MRSQQTSDRLVNFDSGGPVGFSRTRKRGRDRGLMRGYPNLGRRPEAIQVYRRCRQTLSRAFGIQPDPVTEKIHRRLGSG